MMSNEYPEFIRLKEALDSRGETEYQKDLEYLEPRIKKRKRGETFSMSEHLEALVRAKLSSQQKWSTIEPRLEKVREIFHNYDVEYIKTVDPDFLIAEIKRIKCGNRQIKLQMYSLKDNISVLEAIAEEHGSIDNFYNSMPVEKLIKTLSKDGGNYKLKGFQDALAAEYLRNVGCVAAKADTHLLKILAQWGYIKNTKVNPEEVQEVCKNIAKEYGVSTDYVDAIIWRGGETGIAYELI